MKIAAAAAIAHYVPRPKLSSKYVLPSALDRGVAKVVASAAKSGASS